MTLVAWLCHPWALLWTHALLHFLWQGALLTVLAGWALHFRQPNVRYAVLVSLFGLMTACPVLTTIWLSQSTATSVSAVTSGLLNAEVNLSESTTIVDSEATHRWMLLDSIRDLPSAPTVREGFPDLQPVILAGWCFGVSVLFLRLLIGAIGLSRLISSSQTAPGDWIDVTQRLGLRLGFHRPVQIGISAAVCEPLAAWWWRPVILLPAAWLAEIPPRVLEAVVAHELSHLRRCDLWLNYYQRLGEAVLFYHPGVWWVSRRIRIEREVCCDALAVSLSGEPVSYAQALEYVACKRLEQVRPLLAAGMGGTEMTLLSRIQRVLGMESPRQTSGGWTLGLASLAIFAAGGLLLAVSSRDVVGNEPTDPVSGSFLAEGDREGPPPDRPPGPPDGDRPPREGGPPPGGPRGDGPPRRGEFGPPGGGPRDGGERGPGRRPGPPGEGGDRGGPPPGGDMMRDLMDEIRALRDEVARLREEVRGLRGDRGPGGPGGPERGMRGPGRGERGPGGPPPDGGRGGPPRGEGAGPDGRGPRGGGFGPPRPPQDGERGGPDGRRGPPPGDRRDGPPPGDGPPGERPRRPPMDDAPK